MKKDFDFEMFLDEHGDVFPQYLSQICAREYGTERHEKLTGKIERIYEKYPKIAEIIDMDRPASLTEEECEVLIELLHTKELIDDIRAKEIYFQGCWDCVKHLKTMNLITDNM